MREIALHSYADRAVKNRRLFRHCVHPESRYVQNALGDEGRHWISLSFPADFLKTARRSHRRQASFHPGKERAREALNHARQT
eukprot:6174578-Pleurochrysis_carterae.AAC.5